MNEPTRRPSSTRGARRRAARRAPRRRRGRGLLGCGGIIVLLGACLVLAALGYGWYAFNQPEPTLPFVKITLPRPGSQETIKQPVLVFAQAEDPDGIARVEFWVNGQLVATQANPEPQADDLFLASQAWQPTGPGRYMLFVRAEDTQGYLGQSEAVLIETLPYTAVELDPDASAQYIAEEGDTVEAIAVAFETTPDEVRARNPDLDAGEEPAPGDSVFVPISPEPEGPSDDAPAPGDRPPDAPPGGGPEEIPRVDPAPPPAPPPAEGAPSEGVPPEEEATPTERLSPPWWDGYDPAGLLCVLTPALCASPTTDEGSSTDSGSPLWWGGLADPDVICALAPGLCGIPEPGATPPATPAEVRAAVAGDCQVEISWLDASEDEVGFKIYRYGPRGRSMSLDLIAPVSASPAAGNRLRYTDTGAQQGNNTYYVSAFNAAGTNHSALAEISVTCPAGLMGDGRESIVVEALGMETAESYERLYCYFSLDESPYERVPRSSGAFITLEAGVWNIAEHLGGSNSRELLVAGGPLEVAVECLGWRGDTLESLGSFSRSHPSEEWDGRRIDSGPDDGRFKIGYRIMPGGRGGGGGEGEGEERPWWSAFSTDISAPYNLRQTEGYQQCYPEESGRLNICRHPGDPGIAWDWTPSLSRSLQYFKVYRRLPLESRPGLYHSAWPPARSAPLSPIGPRGLFTCDERAFYSVSAVVQDVLFGGTMESPLSEEFEVIRDYCDDEIAVIEVELISLAAGNDLDDGIGDSTMEAYGSFDVWIPSEGTLRSFEWNDYPDGLLGGPSSGYTSIRYGRGSGIVYPWENFYLQIEDFGPYYSYLPSLGTWRARRQHSQHNNVLYIPIFGGERFYISWRYFDHDPEPFNDIWCHGVRRFGPRSAAEWILYNQLYIGRGYGPDGSCDVTYRVRGHPWSYLNP